MSTIITKAWEKNLAGIYLNNEDTEEIKNVIDSLDKGKIRVCEKKNNEWIVNDWIKKAIIMYLKNNEAVLYEFGKTKNNISNFCYDKVPLKFENWNDVDFKDTKIRVVPGSIVRRGAFLDKDTVVMPSFINIGAWVGEKTMIDSMTTIGSCAQIGKKCHISSQVCIGGVLEPLQSKPTIIEDNCFIGTGSTITEGVLIEEGSVIASGVHITNSTKIIDKESGEITYGLVPKNSVVISGNIKIENKTNLDISGYCAIIIKKKDENTISKTSINEMLRDLLK